MTAELASLLPRNATGWEQAVERTSGERWEVLDIDIIRRAKDPFRCPEHLLPFLAFERSVDVWDDAWPVERKRKVIADAPEDHRRKGTLEGIRRYLIHADARLVRAIVPPNKAYPGPALTDEERKAWVARFPQLRIYPYVAGETVRYKTFTNVAGGYRKAFVGRKYPYDAGTDQRYKRTAFLFEPRDGSLTSLEHRTVKRTSFTGEAFEAQEIILPSVASTAIHANQKPKAKRFFGVSGIRERIVTIRTPLTYGYTVEQSQYITVSPSLEPIDVRPIMQHQVGQRRPGARFCNTPRYGAFMPKSTAWQRIYEVVYLHDPSRLPTGGPRTTHTRAKRLGHPLKTAIVRAKVQGRRPRMGVGRFVGGYFLPKDHKHLDRAVDALRAAKSLSDRILLNPKSLRLPRVGDRITVGELRVGQLIPA